MHWSTGLGIVLAPIIGRYLYLYPAKAAHNYLWRKVKNERIRSILFKKL